MQVRHGAMLALWFALVGAPLPVFAEAIVVNGQGFDGRQDSASSDSFRKGRSRCATPAPSVEVAALLRSQADCSSSNTTILPEYDPVEIVTLEIVVHVIRTTGGSGDVSDALIHSQIDVLNEDFLAIAETNGGSGSYSAVRFRLATMDPLGSPTTGIRRYNNTTWFDDLPASMYWVPTEWDPTRYINVYTNSGGGSLGYVPAIPQAGIAGTSGDRIVIAWDAFGRDAPAGPPYDQGRTLTHEMGHYLGLLHTFNNSTICPSAGACYNNGDLICDTNPEQTPVFGCPSSSSSCGSTDPFDNYMDYANDLCMARFTPEQVNRIRCTIENWRPTLPIRLRQWPGIAPDRLAATEETERIGAAARSAGMLRQNVPNPFSPVTTIAFDLPVAGNATLRVLDVAGRTVRTLADGTYSAGRHDVTWNGTDDAAGSVAAGVYFYRLETSAGTETRRMVKMK